MAISADVRNTASDQEHATTEETNAQPSNASAQIRMSRDMPLESIDTVTEQDDVIRANKASVPNDIDRTRQSGEVSRGIQTAPMTARNLSVAVSSPQNTVRRRTRTPRSGLASRNVRRRGQ